MPLRFRCAYCNQLMSIARRKAGAVVRCPRCAGEVIVPVPQEAPAGGPARFQQLLEDDDFGKELDDVQAVPDDRHGPLPPRPAEPSLTESANRSPETSGTPPSRNLALRGIFVPTPALILT